MAEQTTRSLVSYRGRLAPSPTGYLHLGHARTFWTAQQRAVNAGGTLVLRNEDLDRARCKTEFVTAMIEDLKWFGFHWQEGLRVAPGRVLIERESCGHDPIGFIRLKTASPVSRLTLTWQEP